MPHKLHNQNSNIIWDENTPSSRIFEDIYYDKNNGLEESKYVFVDANNLEKRLESPTANFTIIETGFGTGLNFFCLYNLWKRLDKKPQKLNFISIEKYPLPKSEIAKALSYWQELNGLTDNFLSQYDPETDVCNISLENSQIEITILFCDISKAWGKINKQADAWFLDGFSPSKNPDMWSEELFKNMQKLSKDNATFSTFTCAGFIRRALIQNNFIVEKTKGFGNKRTMLKGKFSNN